MCPLPCIDKLTPPFTLFHSSILSSLSARYDEPSLLKDIEKRLGRPIPTMAPDLSLPEEIAAKMVRRRVETFACTSFTRGNGCSLSCEHTGWHRLLSVRFLPN